MAPPIHDLGGPLRCRVEQRDRANWVELAGRINEATDFKPLTKLPGPLVIDLAGIERINSIGVRRWIFFVEHCEAANVEVVFVRCSAIMVQQMGMITNFMGSRSRVQSVLVPYVGVSCNHEHDELLEIAPGAQLRMELPCPKCRSPMRLDDMPETFNEVLMSQLEGRPMRRVVSG